MKNFLLILFTLIFSFFFNYKDLNASTINIEDTSNIESIQSEVGELKDKKEVKSQKSEKDLFGDEQTFPFVAGLGKNAAH